MAGKQFSVSVLLKAIDQMTAPTSKMKGALGGLTDKLDAYKKKWGSGAAGKSGGAFASIFGGVTAGALAAQGITTAISKVKEFAASGLQLASDLTEVQNVVDTTFGAGAAKINKWSKEAMTAFGLSELQAKKFTGTMGAMLKSSGLTGDKIGEMSTKLAGLAGDFASFYNLDAQEAFDKIRSGISGETEPLKQLGINMSVANLEAYALTLGIKKKMQAMSQGEQAQLRYLYLLKASTDAQGDFSKTLATSYANQKRVAENKMASTAARVMTAALPLALKFQRSIGDIADRVSTWVDANESLIGQKLERAFTVATTAAKALWQGLKLVGGVTRTLWNAGVIQAVLAGVAAFKVITFAARVYEGVMLGLKVAQFAAANAGAVLNAVMAANPVGLIAVGAALAIGGLVLLVKNWDGVVAGFKTGLAWIGKAFSGTWDAIKAAAGATWDFLKMGFFGAADVILTIFGGLAKTVLGLGASIGKALGIDTGGLDKAIAGISEMQAQVRSQTAWATPTGAAVPTAAAHGGEKNKTEVVVDFRGLPKGTRVESTGAQKGLNMSMGYANVGF